MNIKGVKMARTPGGTIIVSEYWETTTTVSVPLFSVNAKTGKQEPNGQRVQIPQSTGEWKETHYAKEDEAKAKAHLDKAQAQIAMAG